MIDCFGGNTEETEDDENGETIENAGSRAGWPKKAYQLSVLYDTILGLMIFFPEGSSMNSLMSNLCTIRAIDFLPGGKLDEFTHVKILSI